MTTATEHHDAQLAAIKERHAALAAKFSDPAVTRVGPDEMVAATFAQVGLSEVKVDPLGRFWRVDGVLGATMVFDPFSLSRVDPDDTQAAQGFAAHEG